MTPTLQGRWQSRLFTMSTVGAFVTLIYGLAYEDIPTLFAVLGYVLIVGMIMDIPYHFIIQQLRWDGDWPPAYVFFFGICEAIVVWMLISAIDLPGVNIGLRDTPGRFLLHYSTVWLGVFMMLFGGLRLIFPRWRFHGGRIGGPIALSILVIWTLFVILGASMNFT